MPQVDEWESIQCVFGVAVAAAFAPDALSLLVLVVLVLFAGFRPAGVAFHVVLDILAPDHELGELEAGLAAAVQGRGEGSQGPVEQTVAAS